MTLFALFALGLCAALAALELLARRAFRRRGRKYVWTPFKRAELAIDREALPELPERAEQRFNADGERGAELPRGACYRILVAGGSAAECYLLDQAASWPERLAAELRAAGPRAGFGAVHVGNVARSLVSCEYITRILAELLPHYARLDAIVFMVGASDVVFWLEQGTPAQLEEGRLDDAYVFAELPDGPFGWSLRHSALRRLVERALARAGRRVERRERAGKRLIELRAMRARAEIIDQVPDPAPLLAYFEKHFRLLLARAKASGARVLVARQPWLERDFTPAEEARLWNFGRGRPYQEEVREYYSHRVVDALLAAVDASAVRIADELGVEHVDLAAELEMSFAHFYDRLHFTPAGAAAVGAALARRLASPRPPTAARGEPERGRPTHLDRRAPL